MEDSTSTSASTVRSLNQNQNRYTEGATTSESQRDSWESHVPLVVDINSSMWCTSNSSGGTELDHHEPLTMTTTLSNYSGTIISATSSPRPNALVLPAPPDSPGISRSPSIYSASESSLPSVSSSFFFSSSAPGSPGRSHSGSYPSSHPHSDHEHDQEYDHHDSNENQHHARVSEQGLIIPSLTLPDALRRPTPYGQTLGTLKILVLGGQGAGKSFLTGLLLEDNEDVVEVGTWEDWYGGENGGAGVYGYGKVLRASTDWLEHHGVFGLERFEPSKNVEIVELPGYSHDADANEMITRIKGIIETPFRAIHDVLHPETEPSGVIASLLTASSSPLYTALVFLLPSSPTPLDREIILALSRHIPLIVLPRLQGTHQEPKNTAFSSAKLSRFRPANAVGLRNGLFHSPETASLLRSEAVDRFLKWREVERTVADIWEGSHLWDPAKRTNVLNSNTMRRRAGRPSARRLGEKEWGRSQMEFEGEQLRGPDAKVEEVWNKAKWEAEWMESHSQDVARRMRQGTITKRDSQSSASQKLGPSDSVLPKADDEPDSHASSHPSDFGPGLRRCAREHTHVPFDPLHLPSLFFFSVSLLGPLKNRVGDSLKGVVEAMNETRVRFALLSGFCVGLGVGVWVRTL